ncbi:hypothetical protein B566_EDAN010030 [Ephemera danica]|nr:hypothetical protein B566_EDAN010030 [Ephemera danica]
MRSHPKETAHQGDSHADQSPGGRRRGQWRRHLLTSPSIYPATACKGPWRRARTGHKPSSTSHVTAGVTTKTFQLVDCAANETQIFEIVSSLLATAEWRIVLGNPPSLASRINHHKLMHVPCTRSIFLLFVLCASVSPRCVHPYYKVDFTTEFYRRTISLTQKPSLIHFSSGAGPQNSHGSTLLMLAVITYKINIFNFLCTYNPDANVQNYDADNVLHEVLKGRLYNDASVIKRILNLGIDVNLVEGDGETALEIAVKAGCNSRIIEMLLDKGATLPEPDLDEKTIVMHAIEDGGENFIQTVETLKVLFKHGADASAKDEKGHNAMYYLISECLPNALHVPYHAKRLNEILIELIERNCEVQGLHRTFQRSEIVNDDRLIRKIPVAYNVIALLVRYTRSIGLPKALVERSLYSKKLSSPYILSPLSACLVQLITDTHIGAEAGLEILDLAIQLILLGTDDVYQCAWQDLCSPDISLSLNFKYRTRAEYQASIARKLAIPDALFFAANMRIFNYVIALDIRITAEESTVYKVHAAVEELLRLLLRFWPHPPLLLMLLRVDPVWCPLLVTRTGFSSTTETGMLFMMQVLAKIGGSLPLGTRYYTILKSALQQMAESHDLCKSMLKMLLQLDGGIPTLRSLSRAAFRATVKKTCPTGLDFSEYRVLCQGEMVPLPPDVVNYLEYRNTTDEKNVNEDSSDNTDSISTDDSSLSSDDHFHRDDDCICGGDNSDSDWTDVNCVELKKAKVEIVKNVCRHNQLHRAIKLHDCRMIRQLLEDGVKPCIKFKNNRRYHDASIIKRILDLGIDVSAVNCIGETALAFAIKEGKNADIIEMLLDRGATLPPPDEDGKTLVMHAIEADNNIFSDKVEVLEVLFKHGADAGAKDKNGHNAMYYAICACITDDSNITYGIKSLEEIIILLLERNCELQDLDRLCKRNMAISMICDCSIRIVPVTYDVISTIVFSNLSIELIKVLVNRGLYSRTISNPCNVLSPLSSCLLHLLQGVVFETGQKILKLAKELILLGIDVSQRIWHELGCPGYTKPLEYKHRIRAEYQAAVARELEIPDALFFAANVRICYDTIVGPEGSRDDEIYEVHAAVEELLRMLLRFWPHPPLLLMLLRVDPLWSTLMLTITGFSSTTETGMIFMMQVLAKIGGPLPLGTRYYTILKSSLQRMAERRYLCQSMLDILLKPDGGIPTLRNLSRAAFRPTVKKTCSTGLDFSEYRVLCQGGMVPIPEEIVNFLNYKV